MFPDKAGNETGSKHFAPKNRRPGMYAVGRLHRRKELENREWQVCYDAGKEGVGNNELYHARITRSRDSGKRIAEAVAGTSHYRGQDLRAEIAD